MFRKALLTTAILGALAISAPRADAAVFGHLDLTGASDEYTLPPLEAGDLGFVTGGAAAGVTFTHTILFTAAQGLTATLNAAAPNISGFVSLGDLLYSINGGPSVAAGTLLTGALLDGVLANSVTITGTVTGSVFGNYKLDIFVTPVPAAIALLGPALMGLGFATTRRRA